MEDHEVAGLLAGEAGDLLLEIRDRAMAEGWSPNRLRDEGDRQAHRLLVDRLNGLRPHDALLSEEGQDDGARVDAERVWIVDPLDGTHDFGRPGSIEWAVHVALVVDGSPSAAAVCLPASRRLYGTAMSTAARPAERDRPVVITSRSQWGEAEEVAAAIGGVVRSCGSAGVKAMAVVAGSADVYVHPSGLYEWDACAPAGVAMAAGLDVHGVDGSRLQFNKARPVVPGLVISRPEYTVSVLGALRW
ncbi:MAG: 3'(2'),5'-bisphosphate nucleotidase CysQ [Acidimicrobiales bacterium]|jgi:3'(2'), 5'-bisphosphate nucleotidase|nr:3'(2'),5'-bisphosphate nucleotidase CysQ [Acidimicrobiia bacterium]